MPIGRDITRFKPAPQILPIWYRLHSSRLTLRSSRTPPALPSALSHHLAISAPLIASVQAWPLSFIVRRSTHCPSLLPTITKESSWQPRLSIPQRASVRAATAAHQSSAIPLFGRGATFLSPWLLAASGLWCSQSVIFHGAAPNAGRKPKI